MNTWHNTQAAPYTKRVRLLVELIPLLAREPSFALKGGTAINLFEHDLPRLPSDFEATFEVHFKGMTTAPITLEALLENRRQLLARVAQWLDAPARAFLHSFENEQPDFDLIGLPQAAHLPAIRRKLQNLAQRSPAKREADLQKLEETLAQL